jgi:hypothetical protein
MLSDGTFAVFYYPVVLVCSEYHAEIPKRNTPTGTPASLVALLTSSMRGSSLSPTSGYPVRQFSFRPPTQCFTPVRLVEYVKFMPHAHHAAENIRPQLDMLHSLSGFPFQISRGVIGCGFCHLVLLPTTCSKWNFIAPRAMYCSLLWAHVWFKHAA